MASSTRATSSPRHSWFLPHTPRPRITPDVPTEVVSFPSSRRDSDTASNFSSTSKFKEHLDLDPIRIPGTDEKASSRSHFSPSTPAMEKGLEGTRPVSLRERVGRALGWAEENGQRDHGHDQCPCATTKTSPRTIWTGFLLALALLFFLGNIIFLDVQLTAVNSTLRQLQLRAARPSAIPNLSASTTTPAPPRATPQPQSNLATLPPPTASCLSQFQSSPPSSDAAAAQFCARCVPTFHDISQDWFVEQASGGEEGRRMLQALNGAVDVCNAMSARVGS